MLLVWQGRSSRMHWQIGGHRVTLPCLVNTLKYYWNSVEYNFNGVAAIDVILIDLTVRDTKSYILFFTKMSSKSSIF